MKIIWISIFLIIFSHAIIRSVFAADASLKCSPATGSYKEGDIFSVDFVLDTRVASSSGATVVAVFDPIMLVPQTVSSNPLILTTAWSAPVTNTIDATLGKITLDFGLNQPLYTGTTSIGQISFKAKKAGQAQFNFTFFQQYDDTTPAVAKVYGKRDGTNITNILSDVNNCIYVIEGGITPTSSAVTPTLILAPSATSIPGKAINELPRTGVVENTLIIAAIALSLCFGGTVLYRLTG